MLTALLVVSALSISTANTDLPLDMTEDEFDEGESTNNETEALGEFLGSPCEDTCKETLMHVSCNKKTQICECDPGYPVRLGIETGCAKPVNLGEQCFYYQTCMFTDQNADCVQIKHNAICQCKEGFHLATVQKPQKRVFCTQDLVVITTDLSTLLGVASGLAIFTALICFVLKLFSGSRPRHYANTNLAPPIIFAQSGMNGVSVLRGGFTRASSRVLVPSSRAGAARAAAILLISCHLSPSHASVHSSTSSTKSFSARQYEREHENRLLAKARERGKGDGGSTSPRSLENLIDGPLPSESWPQLEEGRDKAFCPDMLNDPPDIPFPDIDQTDSFENPLGAQLHTHGIENPLGSLIHPGMRIGEPVSKQLLRRMESQQARRPDVMQRIEEPPKEPQSRTTDPLQQAIWTTDPLGSQSLQAHRVEDPIASQSDPLNAT